MDGLNGCAVILAGRPSAAQWIESDPLVHLIRLQPFGLASCRQFFGKDYDRALSLCRRDQSLLMLPGFAYLALQQIRSHSQGKTRSRWELYSSFLPRLLREPNSPPGQAHPEPCVGDLELALGRFSYNAIVSANSGLGVIPLDQLDRLCRELRLSIDVLIATGAADLFELDQYPRTRCLVFSQPSLQEAFAAKWVIESGCAGDIISACWDPKWREVIGLIASNDNCNVVELLHSGAQCDDPIHHRLFLAAECAGQTTIPATLETRLIGDLQSLLTTNAFADDALRCLVSMNTHDAHVSAWNVFVAQSHLGAQEALLGLGLAPEHLRSLHTPERLEWLLLQLENRPLSPLGDLLVTAWADSIPPERALAILHGYLADEDVHRNRGLSQLISVLDADSIGQLLREMFPATRMIGHRQLDCLIDGFRQSLQLDSTHIDFLLDAAERFHNYLAVARILEGVSPRLAESHLLRLANEWWMPAGALRQTLVQIAPTVCSRLPDRCIDDLIEGLDGSGGDGTDLAALVFRRCRHRLTRTRLARLLSRIDRERLTAEGIFLVMAATAHVPREAADKILAALSHEDWQVRAAAMRSCWRLSYRCTREHWYACADNLVAATETGRDEERRASIVALSCSGRFIDDETAWYILRTLKDEDFALETSVEEATVRQACARLSPALGDEQIDYVVERICSMRNGRLAAGLCLLLSPERTSGQSLLRLSRHLREASGQVLIEQLLLFLRKANDIGRLDGVRELIE